MKKSIYKVHKWAGVTLGSLLFLLAVSGLGITFRAELLPLAYPELFQISPGTKLLPLTELYESALDYVEKPGTITNLYSAHDPDEAWLFLFKSTNNLFPTMITIDPFTGKIIGEMSMIKNFFALMLFLHANFLLGKAGSYLIGVLGLLLVFFVVSGIYIWLPRKEIRGKFFKTFNFNSFKSSQKTHHLIGILFSLPLFISAVTGFLTVYDLSYYLMRPLRNEPVRVEELQRTSTCTLEEQKNVLRSLRPGTAEKLISIHFCTTKNGLMKVSTGLIDNDFLEGYERLVIDPKTSETLQTFNSSRDPSSWNIKRLFIFPIHSGEYFGFLGKTINFLTGLGLFILWVSGLRLFLKRRRRYS